MSVEDDLRRWVADQRAAERRIREERRGRPIDPDASLARALELMALYDELHGDEPREPTPTAEDLRVYDTWVRLRAALSEKA